MITARSYKAGMQKDDVIKKLKESSGTQFNPAVVQAFIKILEKQA
jgi:HD-GYP domain-containing protein (c-di-GMP phosphodiesterase class II)